MAKVENRGGNASTHEQERRRRLDQVNGVLKEHGLAHPFTHLGDVDDGEIAVLGAEKVIPLGRDTGLALVHLPAQFGPDRTDPQTGQVQAGGRGAFWTVFQTDEHAANNQIIIPFVTDAPEGQETPRDVRRTSVHVNQVNAKLDELGLKPLAPPVNEPRESVTGIANIEDANSKFFTVVVLETRDNRGRRFERPVLFNANSNTGIDGSVFVATVRSATYGGEPRLVVGQNYRPNEGGNLREIPRGFYRPGAELAKVKGLTDTDVPAIDRAIDEFNSETGVTDPRLRLSHMGRLMQDPSFEFSLPSLYGIDIKDPEYGIPDSDPEEKYKVDLLSHGQFFGMIPGVKDAFTLTAIGRNLARKEILRISDRGREAQDRGEKMVLGMPFRVQHGIYTTEALRTSVDGMPVEDSLGPLAVNSGISRIQPEVHYGTTSWNDIRTTAQAKDLPLPRLLYPYQALGELANGTFDIVTAAAVIKTLHAKGYLELDFRNIR